eukprot:683142-Rhodomonas_salina.23
MAESTRGAHARCCIYLMGHQRAAVVLFEIRRQGPATGGGHPPEKQITQHTTGSWATLSQTGKRKAGLRRVDACRPLFGSTACG